MFERFTEPSTLSPTQGGLAVPVFAGLAVVGAVTLIVGLWKWSTTGQFPDAQLLMGPFWALLFWERAESHQGWSAPRQRLRLRVEVALACVFAVVFAYGLYAWIWTYGDLLLPWTSFLYMLLPFGTMRRLERLPPA
jgi:hypothetical protein